MKSLCVVVRQMITCNLGSVNSSHVCKVFARPVGLNTSWTSWSMQQIDSEFYFFIFIFFLNFQVFLQC